MRRADQLPDCGRRGIAVAAVLAVFRRPAVCRGRRRHCARDFHLGASSQLVVRRPRPALGRQPRLDGGGFSFGRPGFTERTVTLLCPRPRRRTFLRGRAGRTAGPATISRMTSSSMRAFTKLGFGNRWNRSLPNCALSLMVPVRDDLVVHRDQHPAGDFVLPARSYASHRQFWPSCNFFITEDVSSEG